MRYYVLERKEKGKEKERGDFSVLSKIDPPRARKLIRKENGERKGAAEADREQDKQAGDLFQEEVWVAEEGSRDLCLVRC